MGLGVGLGLGLGVGLVLGLGEGCLTQRIYSVLPHLGDLPLAAR